MALRAPFARTFVGQYSLRGLTLFREEHREV